MYVQNMLFILEEQIQILFMDVPALLILMFRNVVITSQCLTWYIEKSEAIISVDFNFEF